MSLSELRSLFDLGPDEIGPALLARREDQWFDRKSSRISARDLAESLVAFANAEGGVVVVGLSDGAVEGIAGAPSGRLNEWQQSAFDFTAPTVSCRTRLVDCSRADGSPDRLLVLETDASTQVHSSHRDEVYLRVGDENRKLSFAQRQELVYDKGQASYETTPVVGALPDDLDDEALDTYAQRLGHPAGRRLLGARGLLGRNGEPSVGAVLLFAHEPQRWFPEASVRVLRYRGTERGAGARQQLLHDERIEGPLPNQIDGARDIVRQLLPSTRALGRRGRFEATPIVPEDAWLEAVVNAVIHRSYSIVGDHVRVEVFDDRVEVESPGRFPGVADASDPLHAVRFARNPRIARVLADLDFGQELGEGIRRMYEEMASAGLAAPVFVQTSGSVRVVLSAEAARADLGARVSAEAVELLRQVELVDGLSTAQAMSVMRRSRPYVLRMLRALQDEGLVEWDASGPTDPTARWRAVR
jgi:ATP-dependent DNA helicase RecG